MSTPAEAIGASQPVHVTAPTLSDSDLGEVVASMSGPVPPRSERELGRYQILRELGRGGMGVVLEAYDPVLDRRVALKLLDRELGERHAKRQLREAQALARLSHPNVVAVYEVGTVEGRGFIAMELVEGQSLRQWHHAPRPWSELLDVYLQAGRGLAAAHAEGLIHRDFKPSNCLIDATGRVRVADFGLAGDVEQLRRSNAGDANLEPAPPSNRSRTSQRTSGTPSPFEERITRPGAVVGTLAYMSPEQRQGVVWDARGDQFSFCASFWEALHGDASPSTSITPSAQSGPTPRPR
jgi:serine/threonine protein kinase